MLSDRQAMKSLSSFFPPLGSLRQLEWARRALVREPSAQKRQPVFSHARLAVRGSRCKHAASCTSWRTLVLVGLARSGVDESQLGGSKRHREEDSFFAHRAIGAAAPGDGTCLVEHRIRA